MFQIPMDLTEILSIGENDSIEFKQSATRELAKEVAAFASSRGGVVLIGVVDSGRTIVGIEEDFEVVHQKIQSWIHEFVEPAPPYEIGRIQHNSVEIVMITVSAGAEPAYAFKERFYYRNGEQSQPIPASEIERRFTAKKISQSLSELKKLVDANNPEQNIAAGIYGQSDLATMNYKELVERLSKDLKVYFQERRKSEPDR